MVTRPNSTPLDGGGKVFNRTAPVTALPAHWPADYRALTERRLQAIADNRWIRLVEQPEYKRRWNREPWDKRQQRALRDWLLDHLEARCHAAELLTCAQLAERARQDAAWYLARKEQDGWDAARLTPLLVALDELIPWLKQWHNQIDPDYGERLGDFYDGFLQEELRQLDLPWDELSAWQPPAARRGRR